MNLYNVLINIVIVLGAKLRHFLECRITCLWKSNEQGKNESRYKSVNYKKQRSLPYGIIFAIVWKERDAKGENKSPAIGEAFFIFACMRLLLVQGEVDSNGYGYGSTHHWVVTHTEEAHHLNVSRN